MTLAGERMRLLVRSVRARRRDVYRTLARENIVLGREPARSSSTAPVLPLQQCSMTMNLPWPRSRRVPISGAAATGEVARALVGDARVAGMTSPPVRSSTRDTRLFEIIDGCVRAVSASSTSHFRRGRRSRS